MAKKTEEESTNGAKGGEALLKLINILFDTPTDKLAELTEIPRNAVLPLSIQMMREKALDKERIKARKPLSQVWRESYMQLMRSVGRKHFMIGSTLAQEQAVAEAEKEESEVEF